MTLVAYPEAGEASITMELPVPRDGRWLVTPRIIRRGAAGKGTLKVVLSRAGDARPGPRRGGVEARVDLERPRRPRLVHRHMPPHEAALTLASGAVPVERACS